jgi:uncharacterized protein (DUF4415 family)
MPTAKKPTTTSRPLNAAEIAAAQTAAATSRPKSSKSSKVDWMEGAVTPGGGVASTIAALRRSRGAAKKPAKKKVAIRLDPDLFAAIRASGPER